MKKVFILVCTIVLLITINAPILAHPGRTDAYGGHRDNNNSSGLGNYHYHHGVGPHLHPDGFCEYSSSSSDYTNKTNFHSYEYTSYNSSNRSNTTNDKQTNNSIPAIFFLIIFMSFILISVLRNINKAKQARNMELQINDKIKLQVITEIENNRPAQIKKSLPPRCPNCSSKMIKRYGPYGYFYGCTRFPNCRGSRNIG